jgi:hypothetical protein
MRGKFNQIARQSVIDDQRLAVVLRDATGGVNTRMHPSQLPDNQAEELLNIDISTLGQRRKRNGSILIADDVGDETVVALHDYQRQGYADNLIMVEDSSLWASESEAAWEEIKDDFTPSADVGIVSVKESGIVPDDVIMVSVGSSNWFRFHKDSLNAWDIDDLGNTAGTGSDSPPPSNVGAWYGNRFWVLRNDLLYFSDAYSDDYSDCFDTVSNVFRIPVGEERGIVPTRDKGMIIMGKNGIWNLFPSATPAVTDRPEPIVTSHGVVSKKGWCVLGDNLYYFAQDGLRELKRTATDDLQAGTSYPLSFSLKKEFEEIAWGYIERLTMCPFDNKIFINVPTGINTYTTWVYFPSVGSFTKLEGWSPSAMATHKVSGELRLYYGKVGDGVVYRGWRGYTDEGTTTTNGSAVLMREITKELDFGQPLIRKCGGEIEIEAESAGSGNKFTVYVAKDGGSYDNYWDVTITNETAPVLPVDLPFSLADTFVVRKKLHLEPLGVFRTLQIKIVNNDANTTDIILYSINVTTYAEEYEDE